MQPQCAICQMQMSSHLWPPCEWAVGGVAACGGIDHQRLLRNACVVSQTIYVPHKMAETCVWPNWARGSRGDGTA